MPGYSACANDNCIYAYACARYMMVVDTHWQSYCKFEKGEDGICNGWWPLTDAPFRCYTQTEMEVYQANMKSLKEHK